MKQKKLLSLLLAAALVFSLAAPAAAEETTSEAAPYTVPDDMSGEIVILHTNDVHGAIAGYAKVAALKAAMEEAGAYVLLMDAGDFIQGDPTVSISEGASAVELMNLAGYDVAAPGNHEFDYGYANLAALADEAEFPIVAANVLYGDTVAFGANTVFTTEDGVKIGVFGLDTPETATKAHPAKIEGVTFLAGEALFAAAQEQVDALEAEGCDYIVCLGHLGIDDESAGNRSVDLLAEVSGIDVFIDGHSHSTMEDIAAVAEGNQVGDTVIASTGTKLANIGMVVLDETGITAQSIPAESVSLTDEAVAARAAEIQAQVDEEYGAVFAGTEALLNGEREPGNRTEETNLGDLITDALVWGAEREGEAVDAAVTNGGGIRASIAAGDITKKDVNTVLPFGNTLSIVKVTGAELLEALEASTYCTPTAIGGFPQVSGIVFTVDAGVAYDQGEQYPGSTYYAPASIGRVSIESVGGRDFSLTETYTIATNDFMASGGDTYYAFKAATVNYDLGVSMDEVLMDYITDELGGTVTEARYGQTGGRITVTNAPAETPEEPEAADWADVDADAWYAEAVHYVIENGIMGSTSTEAKVFTPNGTVTRATVFQTLYNMEGQPDSAEMPAEDGAALVSADGDLTWSAFRDISGKWYADAANWAAGIGLAAIPEDGSFNGERAITRAELATVVARYAEYQNMDVTAGGMAMQEMADYDAIPDWALSGMSICFYNGILSGKPGNLLDPNGTAVRTELAVILMNYAKLEPSGTVETDAYTATTVSIPNGDRQVPAVVTIPKGEGPFPAVVMNHGHGGSKDENVGFGGVAAALAEAGIASIRMDFPGCGDSTAPFTENTLSNMKSDSNASLAYLLENYDIDEAKLGILGYSMGGRLALEIISEEGNPYKAVVLLSAAANPGEESIAGILPEGTSIEDAIASAEEKGSFDYTTRYGQNLSLSAQWFEDMLVDPLANIKNYTGPMLVLHGDKDDVVTDATNKLIVAAYPAAEEIVVPDADHGYGFYSDQPAVTAAVEGSISAFFSRNLLGKTSMEDYLATTEYEWFATGKTDYMIQGKMVSQDTEVYNELEDAHYTAQPNGADVILKGTVGEEWVTKLEKVIQTYTKADGSELTAEDFTADTYIELKTKPTTGNFASFVPAELQVEVQTSWGDVLQANRAGVPHGEGDYLVCAVGEDGQPDLTDVWVVNGAVFPSTYDMTNAETEPSAAA